MLNANRSLCLVAIAVALTLLCGVGVGGAGVAGAMPLSEPDDPAAACVSESSCQADDAGRIGRAVPPEPCRAAAVGDAPWRDSNAGSRVEVVDRHGAPVVGATLEPLFPHDGAPLRTDQLGQRRVAHDGAITLRVAAPGYASADVRLAGGAGVRVVLVEAARLLVTVCDDRGRLVPYQPVDLQLLAPQESARRRVRLTTDGGGRLLIEDLARAEYVVRCGVHGPWAGTEVTVALDSGAVVPLPLTVQTADETRYLSAVIAAAPDWLVWRDGVVQNYVIEVEGRAPVQRIGARSVVVVRGEPGERLRVRLMRVLAGPPQELAAAGDWVDGQVGQPAPLVLSLR